MTFSRCIIQSVLSWPRGGHISVYGRPINVRRAVNDDDGPNCAN